MKVIVPMAGSGNRFVEAGYKDPKPLIKVRGRRMIDYICNMFDKDNDEFIFICNEEHVQTTFFREYLEVNVKNCKVMTIPCHKLGPVYTVISGALNDITNDEQVIISYCDTPFLWDYNKFKEFVKDVDGCLVSNKGFHPHSLSRTLMAHSKTVGDDVLEVKEKACYTGNNMNEHASSGVYYFKKGSYIKKYFYQLINEDLNYNGEYYVTLVYNLLIRDGLKVVSYLNDKVMAFGTPEEIQNYEAWQIILDGKQVKNEKDLLDCYRYWKEYRNVKDISQR
jgi:NDP-sugar pyrophosphorylase family protein